MTKNLQPELLLWRPAPRERLLRNVRRLMEMHSSGELGGARMPEDANPNLKRDSSENFHYFTLPMALNYQRNSYTLWESALSTSEPVNDFETPGTTHLQ